MLLASIWLWCAQSRKRSRCNSEVGGSSGDKKEAARQSSCPIYSGLLPCDPMDQMSTTTDPFATNNKSMEKRQ